MILLFQLKRQQGIVPLTWSKNTHPNKDSSHLLSRSKSSSVCGHKTALSGPIRYL